VIRISTFSGYRFNTGFTLIELLVSVAIGSMLILGLSAVTSMISKTLSASSYNHQLTRDAQFAMDQMVRAVANSRRLLLPLADNPNTNWPEHIREQTLPASPPIGSSTLATVVLAVTLPSNIDLDANGIADADNDGDGRIDEDMGGDASNDGMPGLVAIDDNGDGTTDVSTAAAPNKDDDEDNDRAEDIQDGIDNDGDGAIDEDMKDDANNDGKPGIAGVDDDFDLSVDEGDPKDDDEDGQINEDWLDPLVFYLENGSLMQRTPVPWDESGDSTVNGLDFVTRPLAENVTSFRVERISPGAGQVKLVDLIIELSHPQTSETVRLHTRVRVGRAL